MRLPASLLLMVGPLIPGMGAADPLGLMTYDHIPEVYAADMRPLAFSVSYAPITSQVAFVFDASLSEGHLCTTQSAPNLYTMTLLLADVERQNFAFAPVEAIMALVRYRSALIEAYAARSIPPRNIEAVALRYEAFVRSMPPDETLSLDQTNDMYSYLATEDFAASFAEVMAGNSLPLSPCPYGVDLP